MANTVKIDGLRELEAALSQFSKSTARGILHRALKKAAAPIRDQAKADAPVDTGELRDSIVIRTKSTGGGAGKAAYAATMRRGGSKSQAAKAARAANRAAGPQPMTATVSVAADVGHAVFAEFGSRGRPGTSFLSRAMTSRGRDALKLVGSEMRTEIQKSAKRVAARAAKKRNTP